MEHLPLPKQTLRKSSDVIPFICHKDYDGGPFLEFPIRSGMLPALSTGDSLPGRLPYLQHERVCSLPKHELEHLLQTWLFFGLMHEILGQHCRPQDFVHINEYGGEHRKVITTSSLVASLNGWVPQVRSKAIEPLPTYDHIAECLRMTFAVLGAVPEDFDPNMKLSLASLGEVFTFSVNKAFDIQDPARNNKCPLNWSRHIDPIYWKPLFLESGWCISQIARMLIGDNYLQTLHFLANLRQPGCSGAHQDCDEQGCLVHQTNLKNYQTQHTRRDCKCEELVIDSDRIVDILETGSIPLLRVRESHDLNKISVDVSPSTNTSQYVALSHMWADGLGNAQCNALPRCQISFFVRLIRGLSTEAGQLANDLLLWCDTLCCPVRPKAAKDLALSNMRRTYEDASYVLVLDSSLRLYSTEALDHEELCSRILTSGWMSRLWTLQEGILAGVRQRLWFQFQDKAVRSNTLMNGVITTFNSSIIRMGIASYLFRGMSSFTLSFHRSPSNPGVDIRAIDEALQGRAVSVAFDEPLIVCTLLGLDLSKLLDGPDASRIHRMWSLMSSATGGLPKDIVFRVCLRLNEAGFRWAPATMLKRNPRNMSLDTTRGEIGRGFLNPDGLLVRLRAFRISIPGQRKGLHQNPWNVIDLQNYNRMSVRGEDGSWYLISRALPVEQDCTLSDKTLRALLRDNLELQKPNLWATHLWDFFDNKGMRRSNVGLIVSLVNERQNIKYAHSELHVSIGLQSRFAQEMLEMAYQLVRQFSESLPALRIAGFDRNEVDAASPAWKNAFQSLESEMYGISRRQEVQDALAKAGYGSREATTGLLDQLIASIYVGEYAYFIDKVSEDQQWCVD